MQGGKLPAWLLFIVIGIVLAGLMGVLITSVNEVIYCAVFIAIVLIVGYAIYRAKTK